MRSGKYSQHKIPSSPREHEINKWNGAVIGAVIQAAFMIALGFLNPICGLGISTYSLVAGGVASTLAASVIGAYIENFHPRTKLLGAGIAGIVELGLTIVLGFLNPYPVLGLNLLTKQLVWGGLLGFYGSTLLGGLIENTCCRNVCREISPESDVEDIMGDEDDNGLESFADARPQPRRRRKPSSQGSDASVNESLKNSPVRRRGKATGRTPQAVSLPPEEVSSFSEEDREYYGSFSGEPLQRYPARPLNARFVVPARPQEFGTLKPRISGQRS